MAIKTEARLNIFFACTLIIFFMMLMFGLSYVKPNTLNTMPAICIEILIKYL